MVTAITDQLKKMQDLYDKLANQLSEATVNPEGMDQFFVKNKSQHDSVENQFSWESFWGVTDLGVSSEAFPHRNPAELCRLH